jgi:hypothetical protein
MMGFSLFFPYQTVRVVISLLEDVGYATVDLLLADPPSPEDLLRLERIAVATADALERVLRAHARRTRAMAGHTLSKEGRGDLLRLLDRTSLSPL